MWLDLMLFIIAFLVAYEILDKYLANIIDDFHNPWEL